MRAHTFPPAGRAHDAHACIGLCGDAKQACREKTEFVRRPTNRALQTSITIRMHLQDVRILLLYPLKLKNCLGIVSEPTVREFIN